MTDDLNRRVKVEQALLNYAKRGQACPPEECRRLALELGTPTPEQIQKIREEVRRG